MKSLPMPLPAPAPLDESPQLLGDLADAAKTLGHPHRLALLQAVLQRESTVEQLAELAGLSITNASQHLQQLKRAGFIQSRRDGKHVLYRAGSGPVADVVVALQLFAAHQRAEMQRVAADSLERPEALEAMSIESLRHPLDDGALLLDVRSRQDYAAGHIPGAVNIPAEELVRHLAELPRGQAIVAYCGGRYCVLSRQAVALLRARGFEAQRLGDGFPAWQAAGLRIVR
jgi:rhodanese-related sulfurtransferase/predicted transcriptional regulator